MNIIHMKTILKRLEMMIKKKFTDYGKLIIKKQDVTLCVICYLNLLWKIKNCKIVFLLN